ncbi:hypothetical protein ABZ770_43730 [Streptomyces sp. NPDC006654]|uniref:hypothetical protein n=1 Tax=Streptomyces sp. NPDC006654 TaxID=3156897 RepID=UPI0033CC4739
MTNQTTTAPDRPSSSAAAVLLAAHPDLPADSVDAIDVPGLGLTALIQVPDTRALRDWARALGVRAHWTGGSGYGTTHPREAGSPDWPWWRVEYIDTAAAGLPVRLWALEASAHPRALATFLASTVPTTRSETR